MSMSIMQIRKADPEAFIRELAERRVARGIEWLNRNAPDGWALRLFAIRPAGNWVFLPRDCLDNGCVLARAFQTRSDLASNACTTYGYVTYATVMRSFKDLGRNSLDKKLGFVSDSHVSSNLLDAAWETVLSRTLGQETSEPLYHLRVPITRTPVRPDTYDKINKRHSLWRTLGDMLQRFRLPLRSRS